MKNRILPLISLVIVCLATLRPVCADALTPLEPNAQASLTLHYQKDGTAFSDLQIGIYRIAEALPDGSFALIEPFASYPIHIHDITMQEQWRHIAQTLWSYIVADPMQPDREEKTNETGVAHFSDLKTGLYFVREVVAENTDGTYVFNHFMVYVPTPEPDGSYNYAVEAIPKCTNFVPRSHYTVTKLWQDGGNQSLRPTEVTVDIYKDGVLYETQILGADNNWTYTWSVFGEDHGTWTVAERAVMDIYKVTIQQNGSTFSIINTYETAPEAPPTGDSFTVLPWILAICFSGVMLLVLGVYGRRRK